MIETDVFFEKDQKLIEEHYLPKVKNTASVGQLLYEFFVYYLYEYEPSMQIVSPKDRGGFARKYNPDKMPFSIIDPFD